ncbi:oligosaccharyltransferase complex subunit epsilon [Saxophila tyrrhenica]|uniref:Dolichyl-diphosphooligosaccharide--protein glycosyltransferase subunit OST2 n=1 Tax=Saxophila tyrrhenica TaxID=1690608 RepID=A0AAV9PF97_9PEZI|nr:oligosaccharyltransferase complex subunit epsilon [Saxophila tyrrhenica]
MAPKKTSATQQPSTPKSTTTTTTSSTTTSKPTSSSTASIRNPQDAQQIALGVYNNYIDATPQRTKLLDAFMVFLMTVGLLQFVYCVIAGNYPFNAFLSGFSATVGQFVLTASLRMQTNRENEKEFEGLSHERAFADYVFGSMILHFFCVNFIN